MTQIGQQTNKRWKLIPVSGPNTGQWLVRLQLYIPSVISTPLWRQEVYHCNTTSYIATLQTQCSDTMALQKWSYIVWSAKTLSNQPILCWEQSKRLSLNCLIHFYKRCVSWRLLRFQTLFRTEESPLKIKNKKYLYIAPTIVLLYYCIFCKHIFRGANLDSWVCQ